LKEPVIPQDDKARVKTLQCLNILDTQHEERFDRIARLAAQLFQCEFASISFIDEKRQWFKSLVNLSLEQTTRETAFCAHTINHASTFIVPDTHQSETFKGNPFVINAPHIRFYAGTPIVVNGHRIGALCVFDSKPRTFSPQEEGQLSDLCRLVESELNREELTWLTAQLSQKQTALEENQKLTRVRSVILEKVVNCESLPSVLKHIVESIEEEYLNQYCSVLLLEGNRLRMGAAPSLPAFYNDIIDGVEIGVGQGSCGTAAFTNARTVVEDINVHPYWTAWKACAQQANLGACWSEPIRGADGAVLGTFAIYHEHAATPSKDELVRIEEFAHLASIAIERERANQIIWRQANYDVLTNLPNRKLMEEQLKQAISIASRKQSKVAVLLLDLDNFKDINDTLGHSVGDLLLIEGAKRIESCVSSKDTVSRLGGDEFVLIINDVTNFIELEKVAQNILQTMSLPFELQEHKVHSSASIGVTVFPDDARDIVNLLKNADQAMYSAKAARKNSYHYYTKALRDQALKRMGLLSDLRTAIDEGQLFIEYQPIVDIQTTSIVKAEALIRWHHPSRGRIAPDEFIGIAEEFGLISEISNWVFAQVCTKVKRWRRHFGQFLQISVNTSPKQYADSDTCITHWLQYLLDTNTPANAIVLEITENLLMEGDDRISEKLFQFRQAGIDIALDDFGTGYSSISYLKKYPTDLIKIDRSFVNSMTEVSNDKVLCEAIIVMAKKLGISVVAEGIETKEQHHILSQMGCDFGQGYLYSRPVDAETFEGLLIAQHRQTATP